MSVRRRVVHPLSPTTFLRRNAGKTVPLIAVIMLAVVLIQSIITLINSIPLSVRTIYRSTDRFLGVSPRLNPALTKSLVEKITTNPPVEIDRVLICRTSSAQVRSIVGKWPFVVVGLTPEDRQYYLRRQGMTDLRGRDVVEGAPEVVISEPVATNLGLKIGDVMLRPEDSDNYSPKEVKVVGIAKTDRWIAVGSKRYYESYQPLPIDLAMVCTKRLSDQSTFDRWAEETLKGQYAQVFAFHQIEEQSNEMFVILYKILNVVITILVLVITVMMGMLMNIYQNQRLVEFGLLQAIGFTKGQLLKRVLIESVIVIVGGWSIGTGAAILLLRGLKANLMDPQGFALDIGDRSAYLYTLPVPVAILIIAVLTIVFRFRRFDPVAVVERRLV